MEVRAMGKFEVITPIGAIEVMADELQTIINDLHFIRDGYEIARFNRDKIFGWIDRTGETDANMVQ
jgi:hypothetical protein